VDNHSELGSTEKGLLCSLSFFAIQLLGSGVSSVRVQKICGWKDLKTMERYVRLAGVDERGATELKNGIPLTDCALVSIPRLGN